MARPSTRSVYDFALLESAKSALRIAVGQGAQLLDIHRTTETYANDFTRETVRSLLRSATALLSDISCVLQHLDSVPVPLTRGQGARRANLGRRARIIEYELPFIVAHAEAYNSQLYQVLTQLWDGKAVTYPQHRRVKDAALALFEDLLELRTKLDFHLRHFLED